MSRKSAGKQGNETKSPKLLNLSWSLAELPSSQHRCGLAGLVMMIRWLDRQPITSPRVCEIVSLGAHSLEIRLDKAGLVALMDQVYGASLEEQIRDSPLKNQKTKELVPPLRIEEEVATDEKTGKTTSKKRYVYEQVVPKGAFLEDHDPSVGAANKPLWTKLWRDMVWSILRGIPAQRRPFERRAQGEDSGDVESVWASLIDKRNPSVELPSTYFLGAQANTAELVPFRDRARTQFLLHFAAFVFQIHVPSVVQRDGQRKNQGFALSVPDVADLEIFCELLPSFLRTRSADAAGYLPRGSLVELPLESGMDFLARLRQQLTSTAGRTEAYSVVLGIDVFHVEKDGNNVRVRGVTRVDPTPMMVDEYVRLRASYRNSVFWRHRLFNFFSGLPWYSGFDRIAAVTPKEQTILSRGFREDARTAFNIEGGSKR